MNYSTKNLKRLNIFNPQQPQATYWLDLRQNHHLDQSIKKYHLKKAAVAADHLQVINGQINYRPKQRILKQKLKNCIVKSINKMINSIRLTI